ncbi:MAG: hypothetical protein IJW65_05610 [Clostridia bacterium]|nr:hypothetical protein [Clostridia bacterium]
MKKKIIIFIAVIITIIVVATLTLTNMFTKGVITGKLYRVDNVYEEIYNMVIAERNGAETVLTTSIEGSEVDYDFGCFEQVNIPVNEEYAVVLSFVNQDELGIWIFENNNFENNGISRKSSVYVYNYQSNTLYGNREEAHLIEVFISPYFSWVGTQEKFNLDNHGNYTFVYTEYPLSHNGY